MPSWPPRDWRALLALSASVLGAGALTVFAVWQTWILVYGAWSPGSEGLRLQYLGNSHLITIGGVLIVLLSLGLAINRRSIKLSRDGFEATGGEDEDNA